MLSKIQRHLKAVNDKIEKFLLWSSSVMFVVMIGCNAIEIFTRTVFSYSFSWVQELSVLLLGTIVFFGGCVVFRRKKDATVTFLIEKLLPTRIIKILMFIYNLTIIFYLVILTNYAVKLQSLQAMAEAVYLPITMNWFSFPIIIFAIVSALAFIEHNIEIITNFDGKGNVL